MAVRKMDRREEGRIGWGCGYAWNILGMLSSWDEGVEKWRLSLTRMRFVSVYSKGQDAVELRVF